MKLNIHEWDFSELAAYSLANTPEASQAYTNDKPNLIRNFASVIGGFTKNLKKRYRLRTQDFGNVAGFQALSTEVQSWK